MVRRPSVGWRANGMSAAHPLAAAAAPTAIAPTLASLMVMAQDFATAWSRIGSKVDQTGNRLAEAEACKKELRVALEQALGQAGVSPDGARLDKLSAAGGFVHGLSDGAPAFRIFSSDTWHPTLRTAIDELKTKGANDE